MNSLFRPRPLGHGTKKEKPFITNSFSFPRRWYRYLQDLCLRSSDTLNFVLPLALLLANTALPLAVDIRSLKPCLFLLFRFDG
jgi:hypothetical protein